MKLRPEVKAAMEQLDIDELRRNQIKPINAILDGQDTMVIAPTSYGKSLVYQIPALAQKNALTVVLEPLLALIHDQVQHLNSRYTDANARPAIIEFLDYIRTNDDFGNYTTQLLQKAIEKVQEVRCDEKMEVAYMMWELKLQDAVEEGREKGREEGREEGRTEGRREGREEGRQEGIIAVALKMLKRDRPIQEIEEDTGLTHEEIERLRMGE